MYEDPSRIEVTLSLSDNDSTNHPSEFSFSNNISPNITNRRAVVHGTLASHPAQHENTTNITNRRQVDDRRNRLDQGKLQSASKTPHDYSLNIPCHVHSISKNDPCVAVKLSPRSGHPSVHHCTTPLFAALLYSDPECASPCHDSSTNHSPHSSNCDTSSLPCQAKKKTEEIGTDHQLTYCGSSEPYSAIKDSSFYDLVKCFDPVPSHSGIRNSACVSSPTPLPPATGAFHQQVLYPEVSNDIISQGSASNKDCGLSFAQNVLTHASAPSKTHKKHEMSHCNETKAVADRMSALQSAAYYHSDTHSSESDPNTADYRMCPCSYNSVSSDGKSHSMKIHSNSFIPNQCGTSYYNCHAKNCQYSVTHMPQTEFNKQALAPCDHSSHCSSFLFAAPSFSVQGTVRNVGKSCYVDEDCSYLFESALLDESCHNLQISGHLDDENNTKVQCGDQHLIVNEKLQTSDPSHENVIKSNQSHMSQQQQMSDLSHNNQDNNGQQMSTNNNQDIGGQSSINLQTCDQSIHDHDNQYVSGHALNNRAESEQFLKKIDVDGHFTKTQNMGGQPPNNQDFGCQSPINRDELLKNLNVMDQFSKNCGHPSIYQGVNGQSHHNELHISDRLRNTQCSQSDNSRQENSQSYKNQQMSGQNTNTNHGKERFEHIISSENKDNRLHVVTGKDHLNDEDLVELIGFGYSDMIDTSGAILGTAWSPSLTETTDDRGVNIIGMHSFSSIVKDDPTCSSVFATNVHQQEDLRKRHSVLSPNLAFSSPNRESLAGLPPTLSNFILSANQPVEPCSVNLSKSSNNTPNKSISAYQVTTPEKRAPPGLTVYQLTVSPSENSTNLSNNNQTIS
eukprot:GHVL01009371.1.p1 GENE.GHVL01009371.1~~GHVL01009371.1.p1  ORF type:complete len:847 (+),score=131.79 GHVL01009371.1:1059-3599(+)